MNYPIGSNRSYAHQASQVFQVVLVVMIKEYDVKVLQLEMIQHCFGGLHHGARPDDQRLVPQPRRAPPPAAGVAHERPAARRPGLVVLEADDGPLQALPLQRPHDPQRAVAEVGANLQHREGAGIVTLLGQGLPHRGLEDVAFLGAEVHAKAVALAVVVEAGDGGVDIALLRDAHDVLQQIVHGHAPPVAVSGRGEPSARQVP
mmetsp:Transcript_27569/g.57313  ORF Transcript_27569/g.57313 Transcript_27569/m.57313 type:complete len:203 (-) Transcript_27569:75-683(-)